MRSKFKDEHNFGMSFFDFYFIFLFFYFFGEIIS